MQRWDVTTMLTIAHKLFAKIHKAKFHSHPNHDINFMARDMSWLPAGIQSIIDGNYTPRCLKRYYFSDERVDQLHLSDRIFQHVLLKILKPTFQHVMNQNCYHFAGPSGVRQATARIQEVLQKERPKYFLRADIKSFYKSILHHKLIEDVKQHYDDPKLIAVLKEIIINPIDTPFGTINPDSGIALRGPLSQFFSGLYLKPLDDAFNSMDVTYVRFQDDVLILCNTRRQLNRCRRKMNEVLQERHLQLSRKKTRLGCIETTEFHFLGISYPPTRLEDNTNTVQANNNTTTSFMSGCNLNESGGGRSIFTSEIACIKWHCSSPKDFA